MRVRSISHGILVGAMLERPWATVSIHVSMMKLQHSYCEVVSFVCIEGGRDTYVAVVELPEALPAKRGCVSETLLDDCVQEGQDEIDTRFLDRRFDSLLRQRRQ
jgi:hypothetical protein